MKKSKLSAILSVLFLSSIFSVACAATFTKFSSKFVKNFKDCDKYQETISSEFEGQSFTTTRKILGWKNGFCKYEEIIKSTQGEYQLNCSFTDVQVDELYEAMKSRSKEVSKYDLETFTKQEDPKTGKSKFVSIGYQTIKGNKAYIAWAKYQNNPYFCTPQKIK